MNKALKKSLSWLLVLATLFSLCAAMSVSVAAATPLDLGKAGASITARYYPDTQTLALTGSGPTNNYIQDGHAVLTGLNRPWDKYSGEIRTVTMSEGITTIGNALFYNLTRLEKCIIPSTVEEIGEWAFGYTNLTSVVIPARTKLIKHFAFSQSSLLGGKYSQCLGTTKIENEHIVGTNGEGSITGASASTNYELVNDLDRTTSPGYVIEASGYFNGLSWSYSSDTKALKIYNEGTSVIPMQGLTIMDYSRPWNIYIGEIESVSIGDNIENIDSYAFAGATKLRTVDLTQAYDIATIEEYAFAGCSALSTLTLPAATKTIEANAFASRSSALTVYTPNTEAVMSEGNGSANETYVTWRYASAGAPTPSTPSGAQSGLLTDCGIMWMYDTTTGTLMLTATMQNAYVPNYSSYLLTPWAGWANNVTAVVIGSNIISIGQNAFSNMPYLSSVTIGPSVQMISQNAFAYTSSLKTIDIPASVVLVGANAFLSSGLISATQQNASMMISDPNYELKAALNQQSTPGTSNSGTIPGTSLAWSYAPTTNTLTISGTGAIPDYLSYLQTPWAQAGLNTLVKTLYVGAGVTRVGEYAFYNMPALTTLNLGTSVQTIGQYAFAYNTALTSVAFPVSVSGVENGAFTGCSSLNTATKANPSMVVLDTNTELKAALDRQYGGGTVTPPVAGTDASATFGVNNSLTWAYTASRNRLMIYPTPTTGGTATNIAMPNFTATSPAPWASLNNSIAEVVISDDIISIGNYSFANMPYLQSVTLGTDIVTIGNYAFYNSIRLPLVAFPASVTTVYSDAFTGCASLTYATKANVSMQVLGTNVELKRALNAQSTPSTPGTSGNVVYGQISGTNLTWSYDMNTNFLSITGSGAIPDYSATNPAPWNLYASAIKAITMQTGVTAIGASAFSGITQVLICTFPIR